MKYMGSKARLSKYLVPILMSNYRDDVIFIDACTGGANIIDKIPSYVPRYANDINPYLIALYTGATEGRLGPFDISRELYTDVRKDYNLKTGKYDAFTIGWVGFMGSANGRFFEGGYSGISLTKIGASRNYIDESIRNFIKQLPLLKNVLFSNIDLLELVPSKKAIIYYDPPYKGTKGYTTNFNYDLFWQHCRNMSDAGHYVYISEYESPEDFVCIWQKELTSSLSANGKIGGSKTSVEKLFIYNPLL